MFGCRCSEISLIPLQDPPSQSRRHACAHSRVAVADFSVKAFLEPLIGLDGLIVTTLQDWAAWACVVSAASAALAAVCLEARLTKPRGTGVQSYQASSEGVGDDFREGATRCVCQALSPPARFTRAWRWLEVLVATFWLGPAMLVTHWAWWLPIVLVFYAVPAFIFTTANKLRLKLEDADSPIKFTAAKKLRLKLETLLKSPVLVIMTPTTKGPVPQARWLSELIFVLRRSRSDNLFCLESRCQSKSCLFVCRFKRHCYSS